jgi:hypothetical protein
MAFQHLDFILIAEKTQLEERHVPPGTIVSKMSDVKGAVYRQACGALERQMYFSINLSHMSKYECLTAHSLVYSAPGPARRIRDWLY